MSFTLLVQYTLSLPSNYYRFVDCFYNVVTCLCTLFSGIFLLCFFITKIILVSAFFFFYLLASFFFFVPVYNFFSWSGRVDFFAIVRIFFFLLFLGKIFIARIVASVISVFRIVFFITGASLSGFRCCNPLLWTCFVLFYIDILIVLFFLSSATVFQWYLSVVAASYLVYSL